MDYKKLKRIADKCIRNLKTDIKMKRENGYKLKMGKLKGFIDDNEKVFESNPEYKVELQNQYEEFEKQWAEVEIIIKMTPALKTLKSKKTQINSAIRRKDAKKTETLKTQIEECLNENLEYLNKNEVGLKMVEEINEILSKLGNQEESTTTTTTTTKKTKSTRSKPKPKTTTKTKKTTTSKPNKEMEKIRKNLARHIKNVEVALTRQKIDQVEKKRDLLIKYTEEAKGKVDESQHNDDVFIEIAKLLEHVENEIPNIQDNLKINPMVKKIDATKKKITGFFTRKNMIKIIECQDILLQIEKDLKEQFPENERAKTIVGEINEYLTGIEDQLIGANVETMVESLIKRADRFRTNMMKNHEAEKWDACFKNYDKLNKFLFENRIKFIDAESFKEWLSSGVDSDLKQVREQASDLIIDELSAIKKKITQTRKALSLHVEQENKVGIFIYYFHLRKLLFKLHSYNISYEKLDETVKSTEELLEGVFQDNKEYINEHLSRKIDTEIQYFTKIIDGLAEKNENGEEGLCKANRAHHQLLKLKDQLSTNEGIADGKKLIGGIEKATKVYQAKIASQYNEAVAGRVAKKVDSIFEVMNSHVEKNDKLNIPVFCVTLLTLVYPLRVIGKGKAQEIVAKVDKLVEEHGTPKLDGYMEENVNIALQPIIDLWEEEKGNVKEQGNLLLQIKGKIAKLREYLFAEKVHNFVFSVDQIYYQKFGKSIVDQYYQIGPVLPISWKLNVPVQKSLGMLNEHCENLNEYLWQYQAKLITMQTRSGHREYEIGRLNRKLGILVNEIQKLSKKALKPIESIKKTQPELLEIQFMANGLSELKTFLKHLQTQSEATIKFEEEFSQIVTPTIALTGLIKHAVKETTDAEDSYYISLAGHVGETGYFSCSGLRSINLEDTWAKVVKRIQKLESFTIKLSETEGFDISRLLIHLDNQGNALEEARKEMEKTTENYLRVLVPKSEVEKLDGFIANYKKVFPNNTETYEKFVKLRKQLEEENKEKIRLAKEAYEKKQEEERLARVEQAKEYEKIHKTPYGDGTITTFSSGVWKYTKDGILSCIDGEFKGDNFNWRRFEKRGKMMCEQLDDERGEKGWFLYNGKTLEYGCPYGTCYVINLVDDQPDFGENESLILLQGKTKTEGNPPVLLSVFCFMYKRAQEKKYALKEQWLIRKREEEIRKKQCEMFNRQISNYRCPICNHNGYNIKGCWKCKAIFCSSCCNSNSKCVMCGSYTQVNHYHH
ncbi:hypothetical protein M0812_24240 [Anaeramoeba flamelloides]|uniref:Uncharacterized protein n=1 Tax=Anaeramoeba flamelloides TaxID=1746091 RepID=A0AAV7YJU1_9EUKA|nr:hypothetical protein M0812_24240 [Anaeramoeba flamelloides]